MVGYRLAAVPCAFSGLYVSIQALACVLLGFLVCTALPHCRIAALPAWHAREQAVARCGGLGSHVVEAAARCGYSGAHVVDVVFT